MISEKVKQLEHENAELKAWVEKLQDICGDRVEAPKKCEYCRNFQQYYIKNSGYYYPTYSGFCTAGNRVRKRETTETCKAFAQKTYGKNFI